LPVAFERYSLLVRLAVFSQNGRFGAEIFGETRFPCDWQDLGDLYAESGQT